MPGRAALPAVLFAVLLAACAADLPPEGGAERTLLTTTATAVAVDPATRRLRLRDAADGREFTVAADAGLGDLAGLSPGDVIMVDYFESVALEMAPPGDPGDEIALEAAAPAPTADDPGGVAVASTSLVVEVLGYDPAAGLATVRDADGRTRRLAVPPALAAFAAALSPGDRVLVTITDATVMSVTPADA